MSDVTGCQKTQVPLYIYLICHTGFTVLPENLIGKAFIVLLG